MKKDKRLDSLTYKDSGVDIEEGDRFVRLISPMAKSTFSKGVLTDIGAFGALFEIDKGKFQKPVLVSSTDGVGTKLKIAFMMDKHDTVGIDLVAMCVNDILTLGAEPLFFLDYFATGKLNADKASEVIKGIAEGCKIANCSLIGGETAEMADFYGYDEYDLAGFTVGIVDKDRIIDGRDVKDGDIILGFPSSGIHSNGYSLVRRLFFDIMQWETDKYLKELDCTLGDELLKPTSIYVNDILKILSKFQIKAMAHITGGGMIGNIPRCIPKGYTAIIDKKTWKRQAIFKLIQELGNVSEDEMYRTFNMGIGFVIIIKKDEQREVLDFLISNNIEHYNIGFITKGEGGLLYVDN
ncbi:MAG: phosphoribosylformylglycinamidine cyclo-ligase [Thermodesulfovibrionales bacterium]|nr:phosphoribosylformylglycinamidine cyclo-ligase [Thermodesulfovibrionales bacterium]